MDEMDETPKTGEFVMQMGGVVTSQRVHGTRLCNSLKLTFPAPHSPAPSPLSNGVLHTLMSSTEVCLIGRSLKLSPAAPFKIPNTPKHRDVVGRIIGSEVTCLSFGKSRILSQPPHKMIWNKGVSYRTCESIKAHYKSWCDLPNEMGCKLISKC